MNSTLDEHILQELRALGHSNLDLHKLMAETREEARDQIGDVKAGMMRLEERVAGVINERLRVHSDRLKAIAADSTKRADDLEERVDAVVLEAAEVRGGRMVWAIVGAAMGSVVTGVVTAIAIKATGG